MSEKKDRPDSSQVYFYDEIPRIAACRSCTLLVPIPNIYFMEKQFFKKRRSEQKLHSFGYCTILLVEYDSVEDVVNFTACENQTPTITLNLNRIIDKSLKHIVKDSKVWQEFHLNDSGKKRSFVLHFEKGQEFDEFFIKFSEVLSWLHACKKGKLSVDKKYYLVGFRDDPKEVNTKIKRISDSEERESYYSDSSENSTNDEIDSIFVLTPPFSPKPFTIPPTSRVTGYNEELTAGLLKRPESEEEKRDRYHNNIFGSLYVPPSGDSILKTLTETPSYTLRIKTERNETIESSNTEQSSINRRKNLSGDVDLDKNGTVKHRDFCQSVNITEIDSNCDFRKTVDIAQLDFDNIKGETGNQPDVLIGDEVTDTTIKARQEQNQLKQYAQLLQAAINDGDQENARQYANILAASHLKIAITVDENSLKVEANSQDIKDCLKGAIVHDEEAFLQCPYNDGSYSCYASLQDREIKALEKERQRREAEQSQQNFQQLLRTDDQHNRESFDCPICFDRINPGRGVVLRECLHSFCRDCLKGAIVHNEEAFLRCPYNDGSYSCYASLQDREIKALVPDEIYERYLQKSVSTAESQEMNSFHCKTPDCQGCCIYEDHVNFFKCPVCNKENCLTCKAIHEGVNCKKYQDDLQAQANDNAAARRTRQMLNDMVKKGEAMHCPQCKVILQKKDGCDWLKCSICKTEICWVTKGLRWGPNGPRDISGGCRCGVNGEACHPGCSNCH